MSTACWEPALVCFSFSARCNSSSAWRRLALASSRFALCIESSSSIRGSSAATCWPPRNVTLATRPLVPVVSNRDRDARRVPNASSSTGRLFRFACATSTGDAERCLLLISAESTLSRQTSAQPSRAAGISIPSNTSICLDAGRGRVSVISGRPEQRVHVEFHQVVESSSLVMSMQERYNF